MHPADHVVIQSGFVLLQGTTGEVIDVSPEARRLLGLSHERLVGRDFEAWAKFEGSDEVPVPVSEGESLCCRRWIRTAAGELKPILLNVVRTTIEGQSLLLVGLIDLQSMGEAPRPTQEALLPVEPGPKPGAATSACAVPVNYVEPDFTESILVDRVLGDRELARVVVETFLEDIRQRLVSLEGHSRRLELKSLVLEVHTIKGAAANVGAEALARFAAQFESALQADNAMDCGEWVAQLARRYARAHSEIAASTLMHR